MVMNVLFLSETYYPHGGGAELATYLYARLLSEVGIKVTVVTNRFGDEVGTSKDGSLTIFRLPLFSRFHAVKYSMLARVDVLLSGFLREEIRKADVVYVPRFWFSSIPLAKALGKPVVFHLHDYIPICPLSNCFNHAQNRLCEGSWGGFCSPQCVYSFEKVHCRDLKRVLSSTFLNSVMGQYLPATVSMADAVLCVSEMQRKVVARGAPVLADKMQVVYNPYPDFPSSEIAGDDFGYFGGSDMLKGFQVLQNALLCLRKRLKKVRVHSTKIGMLDNSAFVSKLNGLGLKLYGKLGSEEFEKMYEKVRCTLVPSIWHEPWPYVVVEALVRGRFLIASAVGGIPEQVEGCKGATLFKAEDYDGLAESMEYVAALSREEVVDLGCQNRETFVSRFKNDLSVQNFISICEHLI